MNFVIIDNPPEGSKRQMLKLVSFLCDRKLWHWRRLTFFMENDKTTDLKWSLYIQHGRQSSCVATGAGVIVAFAIIWVIVDKTPIYGCQTDFLMRLL